MGYPNLFFISEGRIYKYEGPRTAEDLEEFTEFGYLDAADQGPFPLTVSSYAKYIKQFKLLGSQMYYQFLASPVYGTIYLSGFIILLVLSCCLGDWISDRFIPQGPGPRVEEAAVQEGGDGAGKKSPGKGKPKRD